MSSVPESTIVQLREDPDGEEEFETNVSKYKEVGHSQKAKSTSAKQKRVFITVFVIVLIALVFIVVVIQTSNRGRRDGNANAATNNRSENPLLLAQPNKFGPLKPSEADDKDVYVHVYDETRGVDSSELPDIQKIDSEILEIHTENDFDGLTKKTKHIKLFSLENLAKTALKHSIEKLEFKNCKLSFELLQQLLLEFNEVKMLIFDSENEITMTTPENLFIVDTNITLPKLQTMEFINMKGTDSSIPIFLQNIHIKNLRNINFKSCNLYSEVFSNFQKLIQIHSKTLKSLEFLDCYFCKECGVSQLMSKLRSLTVLRNKSIPIPIENMKSSLLTT